MNRHSTRRVEIIKNPGQSVANTIEERYKEIQLQQKREN